MDTGTLLTRTDLLTVVSRDIHLKRVAATNGGEWAGPCPRCRDGRDRFRVWPNAERPHFWCRVCGWHGDAITYRRDLYGESFHEACAALRVDPSVLPSSPAFRVLPSAFFPPPPDPCEPPAPTWQDAAARFIVQAQEVLWGAAGDRARAWLLGRGLSPDTMLRANLGYNRWDLYQPARAWCLPHAKPVWLPRGIVIPWMIDGELWRLTIRRPHNVAGSGQSGEA